MRALVVLGLLVLGACATDEKAPSDERQAFAEIRAIFEERILGNGTPVQEARVTSVTHAGIEWIPDGGTVRRLFWSDLDDIESQTDQEKPVHPEALYLYLARGSRSVETSGAERPPLSGAEVVRCYVMLRDRRAGSRVKLVRALRVIGRGRPAPAPAPEAAPPTSASRTTDEKLARLKDLHDRGLISDDVYREEQKKILSEGY